MPDIQKHPELESKNSVNMSLKLQKILKNYVKIWSVFFIFNLFLEGTEGKGPTVPKQDDVAQRT